MQALSRVLLALLLAVILLVDVTAAAQKSKKSKKKKEKRREESDMGAYEDGGGGGGGMPDLSQLMAAIDADGNGRLSRREVRDSGLFGPPGSDGDSMSDQSFDAMDRNASAEHEYLLLAIVRLCKAHLAAFCTEAVGRASGAHGVVSRRVPSPPARPAESLRRLSSAPLTLSGDGL